MLLVIIECNDHQSIGCLARIDVLMFSRKQIQQVAASQRFELNAQLAQEFLMFEDGFLFFIAGGKGVDAVGGKAARKIPAIVRIVAALHCNLVSIIELRRATHRHD